MSLHATDRGVYDRIPEPPMTTAATKIWGKAFFYEKIPREIIVITPSLEQRGGRVKSLRF